ncbi:MAG TPA: hypothetical protein VHL11_11335 [Phototrophicaceae bacterium]|jgi:hypothetical protein|nr:hypothetical protein [Phototrophicaceae bacterium]
MDSSIDNNSIDQADIIRRARRRWLRNKLPTLLLPIHMLFFLIGSLGILAASQELWERLGFPPGWIILGWLLLIVFHWGATTIWLSYHRAVDAEIERERLARAEAWATAKHKRETPHIGIGDDGELVEMEVTEEQLENYPDTRRYQTR